MTITIKKHASFLITSVLLILVLSACGQDTKDVTISEDNTNKETNTDENTDQTEKEEKEAKLGSRSNPVPLQKTATIEDEIYDDSGEAYKIKFLFSILEVKRGEVKKETKKLKAQNSELKNEIDEIKYH